MDTKPLEIQSESYIQHYLIKFGFNVVKPKFDKEGADLLIIDDINSKYTHFLKIQCKGRTLKNSGSSIKIPISYVTDNFIVFLYVINNKYEDILFTFFYEDIIKWKNRNGNYVLNFTPNKLDDIYFSERLFNEITANEIKDRLNNSKIKKYTSIILDGMLLEKAILQTIHLYSEIYPDKKFNPPDIKEIIKNILSMYDTYNSHEKFINCYVYYYKNNFFQTNFLSYDNRFTTENGVQGKIFFDRTENFIWTEILEHLQRIINTENIILVADDIVYEDTLNHLKEKNIDVTLVMFQTEDGRQMFTKHMWGDIIYPIAISLGLDFYEL